MVHKVSPQTLDGFGRFELHIRVTNTPTDRQTHLRATSVAIGRITYAVRVCDEV